MPESSFPATSPHDTYKLFFADLLERRRLVSFFDFVNTEGIFPSLHRMNPHFCLLTMSGGDFEHPPDFAFWNTNVANLRNSNRHFTLDSADLSLLNPNTRTCPIFRTRRDADLTKRIHRQVTTFVNNATGISSWDPEYRQGLFHSSNDASLYNPNTMPTLLQRGGELIGNRIVMRREHLLPMYEGRMIWQFDHRYGTFAGVADRASIQLPRLASINTAGLISLRFPGTGCLRIRWCHGCLNGLICGSSGFVMLPIRPTSVPQSSPSCHGQVLAIRLG